MYHVYIFPAHLGYYILFANGSLITGYYSNIESAFRDAEAGNAFPHIRRSNPSDNLLFTCKSLNDAKENYPEYFI